MFKKKPFLFTDMPVLQKLQEFLNNHMGDGGRSLKEG